MADQDKRQDTKKREYATFTRPDGTTQTLWGTENRVQLPLDGEFQTIVHNHPQGTSLSIGDLEMLVRAAQIEAVGKKRYVVRKGERYEDLAKEFRDVSQKVSSDITHERRIGYRGTPAQERINQELAKRGVIGYQELPLLPTSGSSPEEDLKYRQEVARQLALLQLLSSQLR